jgi:DNA-binding MarR family transcriptional regulator
MSAPTAHDRLARLARTCACINVRRAARALTSYYDTRLLAACGLRATQMTPLVALYLGGPQTINEMAGRLDLDRTTLTRNLRLLEDAGLLDIRSGTDQRTRVVALTRRGTSTLLEALPVWEEAQAHVVQGVGEHRFHSLLGQLSEIVGLTPAD